MILYSNSAEAFRLDVETNQIKDKVRESFYCKMGKKGLNGNKKELSRLVKNIYKVLCSRGLKGCYVYCRDRELQAYMKTRVRAGR